MSFLVMTCAWCGDDYTTGMVGSTLVGSGHVCAVRVPCDRCERTGNVLVAECLGPDGEEGQSFACFDHVGDRVILQLQPRVGGDQ